MKVDFTEKVQVKIPAGGRAHPPPKKEIPSARLSCPWARAPHEPEHSTKWMVTKMKKAAKHTRKPKRRAPRAAASDAAKMLRALASMRGVELPPEGDEDTGAQEQGLYRTPWEEMRAELGDEIVQTYARGAHLLPATLTRGECERLMTAHVKGKWAFRNNLITRVLYMTGMRPGECAHLVVADVDFDGRRIFVRHAKGDKDRYVLVDDETLAMLKTWIKDKQPGDSLFGLGRVGIYLMIKKAGKMTGIAQKYEGMQRGFSGYCFRHSFATHCCENGMNPFALRCLMGHQFIQTTLLYMEISLNFEREQYTKCGPGVK